MPEGFFSHLNKTAHLGKVWEGEGGQRDQEKLVNKGGKKGEGGLKEISKREGEEEKDLEANKERCLM